MVQVGFAHRRLSILDLSPRGRQPMVSADAKYAICFNGEIYNYKELRREMEEAGVEFQTGTDTEVLMQLMIRQGAGALPRLRGMFAFAFLDLAERSVLLARDPFGIKPLYVTASEGTFHFASELRALEILTGGGWGFNKQVLYNFLRFAVGDDGTQTFFDGVVQIPPAHFLKISLDSPIAGIPERYWQIKIAEPVRISFSDAAAELRERFQQSIRLHLRSDVPVGAALSGGIDSSAIVGCMRVAEPDAEIHTFTYAPQGFAMNEEKWARQVAERTGVRQHLVDFSASDLAVDLDRLLQCQQEPFGSTSIYAQYRIFQSAKEHGVTVMLDGQGGDEILAGYPIYFAARLAGMVRRGEWRGLSGLWRNRAIAGGGHPLAWLMATEHLLPKSLANMGRRLVGKELFPDWMRRSYFEDTGIKAGRLEAPLDETGLRGVLAESLARTVIPQLLHFEDRNSMAWSVESRVPFLHVDVVEFALSLPEHYLLGNDGVTKKVFREAMRGLVPDAILNRTDKIGFQTPGNLMLMNAKPWVNSILADIPDAALEVIDPAGLSRLWKRVQEGSMQNDLGLWKALCFVRWLQLAR